MAGGLERLIGKDDVMICRYELFMSVSMHVHTHVDYIYIYIYHRCMIYGYIWNAWVCLVVFFFFLWDVVEQLLRWTTKSLPVGMANPGWTPTIFRTTWHDQRNPGRWGLYEGWTTTLCYAGKNIYPIKVILNYWILNPIKTLLFRVFRGLFKLPSLGSGILINQYKVPY